MSSPEPDAARDLAHDPRRKRVGRVAAARGEHAREQVDPDVEAPVAPLDQAVRVGHDRRARGEGDGRLVDRLRLGEAQRWRARPIESLDLAGLARGQEQGQVPGRRVGQLAGIGIERHAQRGRHRFARDVTPHAAQHLGGRAVVVGVGAEGVAHLPHQDGRGEAAARHVSDGDLHGAVVAVHDVVPVAADLETCAPGLVVTQQLHAVDLRQELREQAALEARGDGVLVLVIAGAGQRLRGLVGIPGDMRPLALVQDTLVGEEQAERARRARAGHAQGRCVEGSARAGERVVHLRQVDAHPRLALDRECEPRLVDARQDLGNDETGRLAAHRYAARLAHGRELESEAILGLECHDRGCARERRLESGREAVRHLAGERCGAERVGELAALAGARVAILGLAPGSQQGPAHEAERDRRSRPEQGEVEHEPSPGRREDIGAGPIDCDRPAR